MTSQNRRHISRRKNEGSCLIAAPSERSMPGEALELTPNAATLEQLRSTARAVARLWRKLAIAPHAFPPPTRSTPCRWRSSR